MARQIFKQQFYGLPGRILAVFIIQAIVTFVLLVMIGLAIFEERSEKNLPLLAEDYIERIVADLPNPLTADSLNKIRAPITFALQDAQGWPILSQKATNTAWLDSLSHLKENEWQPFKHHPDWFWQFHRGQIWAKLAYTDTKKSHSTLWLHFSFKNPNHNPFGLMWALAVIFMMLILTYLWVRKLLNPIKKLQQGVEEFTQGNFSHRLPVAGNNDLSQLSFTMNQMAEEIDNRLEKEHELFIAMSHELRTPLTRMRLAIEMLDNTKLKAALLRSHHAMEELIQALLLREQVQQKTNDVKLESIHLKDWVEQLIETQFTEPLAQGQRLEIVIPVDTQIQTDAFALTLIVKNLIANAIQYGEQKPIQIGFKLLSDTNEAEIWVEDKGIGLSSEEQAALFKPFYRADKARTRESGGLGLGLYLSQALAKRLNGHIEVDSKRHYGSRFSYRFRLK